MSPKKPPRKPAPPARAPRKRTGAAPRRSTKKAAPARKAARNGAAAGKAEAPRPRPEPPPRAGFTVDMAEGVEKALARLREQATHLLKKGKHTRVRIRFRGKEIATVPLAVLVAAEAATFWWAGLLRVLAFNVVGKAVLDVEMINDADTVVAAGKARLLDGELELALAKFREALDMDRDNAAAHLNLGIALKLQGRRDEARAAFVRAAELDAHGEVGKEARRQLEAMGRVDGAAPGAAGSGTPESGGTTPV